MEKMYSFSKSATQFGFSSMHAESHCIGNGSEYTYVDDPKDGNVSSGEDGGERKEHDKNAVQRLTKSAGPAMAYLRSGARRQSADKKSKDSDDSDDDDDDDTDSCYSLPWRLMPNNLIEDLEFYKNAGNYLLS